MLRATTACTFSTSQLPKVVRTWCVLYILTSKCASRHNGVHFFDISTSKSDPNLVCFVHFDFEMCFAPQPCTFSTSQLPKVARDRQFLTLLTSKCASHHNGVQFFIAPVASWLRTRRFSEPTFQPSGATNHWKNTASRLFAHLYLLSSYSFSSDLLSSNLPLLSASALLCFSSVHIVGSLTSKLPSIIYIYIYSIMYVTYIYIYYVFLLDIYIYNIYISIYIYIYIFLITYLNWFDIIYLYIYISVYNTYIFFRFSQIYKDNFQYDI